MGKTRGVNFGLSYRFKLIAETYDRSKTILVVEDNDLNLKLAKTLLQNGGYRVTGAMDTES